MSKTAEISQNKDSYIFIDLDTATQKVDENGRRDSDEATVLSLTLDAYAPDAKIVVLMTEKFNIAEDQIAEATDFCRKRMCAFGAPRRIVERLLECIVVPDDCSRHQKICEFIKQRGLEDAICIAIDSRDRFGAPCASTRASLLPIDPAENSGSDVFRVAAMLTSEASTHMGSQWLDRAKDADDVLASLRRGIHIREEGDSDNSDLWTCCDDPEPVQDETQVDPSDKNEEDMSFGAAPPPLPMPSMYPTPPLEWANEPPLKLRSPWLGMEDIRPEMMSRHWMVVGETGSGKTKSVVLPLLDSLINYQINA